MRSTLLVALDPDLIPDILPAIAAMYLARHPAPVAVWQRALGPEGFATLVDVLPDQAAQLFESIKRQGARPGLDLVPPPP